MASICGSSDSNWKEKTCRQIMPLACWTSTSAVVSRGTSPGPQWCCWQMRYICHVTPDLWPLPMVQYIDSSYTQNDSLESIGMLLLNMLKAQYTTLVRGPLFLSSLPCPSPSHPCPRSWTCYGHVSRRCCTTCLTGPPEPMQAWLCLQWPTPWISQNGSWWTVSPADWWGEGEHMGAVSYPHII